MNLRGVAIRAARAIEVRSMGLARFATRTSRMDDAARAVLVEQRLAQARTSSCPSITTLEETLGFSASNDWLEDLAVATQVTAKTSSSDWDHGRLIYALVRQRIAQLGSDHFVTILETGSAIGFTSLVAARALVDAEAVGAVVSVDMISHDEERYWGTADDYFGPQSRRNILSEWRQEASRVIFVQGVLPQALRRIGMSHVNIAFLDAEHSRSSVRQELAFLDDLQGVGDVVVLDDVHSERFPGVAAAFVEWVKQHELNTTAFGSRGLIAATRTK